MSIITNTTSCGISTETRKAFAEGRISDLTVDEIGELHDFSKSLPASADGGLPKDLAEPQGLVGQIYHWILDNAPCPQPRFALGAALVACGTIFGRQVKSISGQFTNVFAMNVGKTSSGKDHPRKAIDQLLTNCGAEHLRRSKITSDAAIEAALSTDSNLLVSIDEAGHFFNTVNSGMAASYSRTIKQSLLELWSAAGTIWTGKQRGRVNGVLQNVVRVTNPHISFLGGTQPEVFFDGVSRDDLKDGWIPRVLFFSSMAKPRPMFKNEMELPTTIKEAVESWVGENGSDKTLEKPIVVEFTEEAASLRDRCMEQNHNLQMKYEDTDADLVSLLGKCMENTERTALILSVGRHAYKPEEAKISEGDYQYAYNLVRFLTITTYSMIVQNLADTKHERHYKTLLRLIDKAGKNGITKTDLTARTRSMGASRVRNEILAELVDDKKVKSVSIEKGGERYFIC